MKSIILCITTTSRVQILGHIKLFTVTYVRAKQITLSEANTLARCVPLIHFVPQVYVQYIFLEMDCEQKLKDTTV